MSVKTELMEMPKNNDSTIMMFLYFRVKTFSQKFLDKPKTRF